jgi:hypothetical protein
MLCRFALGKLAVVFSFQGAEKGLKGVIDTKSTNKAP